MKVCVKKVCGIIAASVGLSLCFVGAAFAVEPGEGAGSAGVVLSQAEIDEMWAEVDAAYEAQLEADAKDGIVPLAAKGTYPRTKGDILVTKDAYKGLIPTGHAAIIYGSNQVIEALKQGVVTGKNNWNTSKKTCYGAQVIGTTAAKRAKAADWAKKQLGKPYNYNFASINRTDAFYCSQLVWAAYRSAALIDICPSKIAGKAIYPPDLIKSLKTTKIVYRL